jgi:hypothetical protein
MFIIPDIADVVELRTWANDQPYSISSLKEDLEAALEETEMEKAEDYAREVFEEISARARLLGLAYPFSFNGVTLIPNARKANSSYLFCLGLNFFKNIPLRIRSPEFESLVKTAAENYFRGKAIRIGAPWKTATITDYKILLKMVSSLIPDLGPPLRTTAPDGGDAGWDLVVVNNFADEKFSRIIVLGNCATGRSDWLSKGMETQPTFFWEFFSKPPQNKNVCLTFLAVPFLMTDEEKLRKTAATCITFDRIRICEHSPSTSAASMRWVENHRADALDVSLI